MKQKLIVIKGSFRGNKSQSKWKSSERIKLKNIKTTFQLYLNLSNLLTFRILPLKLKFWTENKIQMQERIGMASVLFVI